MRQVSQYQIFKKYVSDGSGAELPEKFEDLPDRDKENIQSLYREFILHWVDHEFKAALSDDDRVKRAATTLVYAFKTQKDGAVESLRMAIGTFVLNVSDHPAVGEGKKLADKIIKTLKEVLGDGHSDPASRE